MVGALLALIASSGRCSRRTSHGSGLGLRVGVGDEVGADALGAGAQRLGARVLGRDAAALTATIAIDKSD